MHRGTPEAVQEITIAASRIVPYLKQSKLEGLICLVTGTEGWRRIDLNEPRLQCSVDQDVIPATTRIAHC